MSLSDWVWSWLTLQLDALAAGGHVGDAAAHLGEHLQLPLVAVVEGLARVFGLVERLVGLGPEDLLIRFIMLMALNLPGGPRMCRESGR